MTRTEENEQITLSVDNLTCLDVLKGISKTTLARFIREYIDNHSEDPFWDTLQDAEATVNTIVETAAKNEKERLQAINLLCSVRYKE
jgi:hypothetical protein